MPDNAYHKSLRLKHFTVFEDAEFAFSPGINALVGENGTGKTHLMKALYAVQLAYSREEHSVREMLTDTFQVPEPAQLKSLRSKGRSVATMQGQYGGWEWEFLVNPDAFPHPTLAKWGRIERPVFIPAIDMMGHTLGFVTTYDEYHIDFDLTHRDIVSLLLGPEQRAPGNGMLPEVARLGGDLGGSLEREGDRFYIHNADGRLPMPVVAEGVRKVATLYRLAQTGWLRPGTTLFWDEPEVNLNPVLMDDVVAATLALARSGVQVFLATHSYVILKELDLQATGDDSMRFFAFSKKGRSGTVVAASDDLSGLLPNAILRHYAGLYDRDLDRAVGRERRRDKV